MKRLDAPSQGRSKGPSPCGQRAGHGQRRILGSRFALGAVVTSMAIGCAVGKPLVASPDDLADYRAFRAAAHPGVRLGRAQRYLDRQPNGAWREEVTRAFEKEEPEYFEGVAVTRAGAREYLVDLPNGPHADAAIARMGIETLEEDPEMQSLLAAARRTEATLERAAQQRAAITPRLLGMLSALLEDGVYGARLEEVSPRLRTALSGLALTSWGAPRRRYDDDWFFSVPTPEGRASRVLTVSFEAVLVSGRVTRGRIEGEDLFVHWAEAGQARALDPTRPADRAQAQAWSLEILEGALEARFPRARCTKSPAPSRGPSVELVIRACDGWSAVVTSSREAGGLDSIEVAGPVVPE